MSYRAAPADGIVWITGASSGIGRSIALELAREGYAVALTARSADKLKALATEIASAGGRAWAAPCDVTDEPATAETVDQIERQHGPIALAIFCTGSNWPTSGSNLSIAAFRNTFDLNFFGILNGLQPVVERFRQRGRGHVAIIASVAGYGGLPDAIAYVSSKAALINLAECLKFDFDRMGIGIQLIDPGFVDTPLTQQIRYPMPFLLPVDVAARRIVAGLHSRRFEIAFPRRMAWLLKFLNLLPYWLYFRIVSRVVGP